MVHDQSRQAHEVLGLLALREVPGTPVYNSADSGTVYAEQMNAEHTIGNCGHSVSLSLSLPLSLSIYIFTYDTYRCAGVDNQAVS